MAGVGREAGPLLYLVAICNYLHKANCFPCVLQGLAAFIFFSSVVDENTLDLLYDLCLIQVPAKVKIAFIQML